MDDSMKIKPGRTTPRIRSATPTSGRSRSKGLDQQQMISLVYGTMARQTTGGTDRMKQSFSDQGLSKSTARAPVYKTQEEYYDEVIALKKKIKELNAEKSMLKLKQRRVEEDYLKKEKEVEQLLDHTKNNEVRRTLADGKTDSGVVVVHSMKQKILKLEKQLRDKESAYSQLQSDLKTTKMEEMKIQLDTFYNEVLRLRTDKGVQPISSERTMAKDGNSRVKALTATILKMSVEKARLQAENKALKQDLQKCLENQDGLKPNYKQSDEDLTQKNIIAALAKLENKFDKLDSQNVFNNSDAGMSQEDIAEFKRLEEELKKEIEKRGNIIEKLKEERDYHVNQCQEKDNEMRSLKKELDNFKSRRNDIPPDVSMFSASPESTSDKLIKKNDDKKNLFSPSPEEVEELRQKNAAKIIQKKWIQHNAQNLEQDEAAELIQSAIKGHKSRKETSNLLKTCLAEDDDEDDDAAELIHSALKGHQFRSQQIKQQSSSQQNPISAQKSTQQLTQQRTEQSVQQKPNKSNYIYSGQSSSKTNQKSAAANVFVSDEDEENIEEDVDEQDDDDDDDIVISKPKK